MIQYHLIDSREELPGVIRTISDSETFLKFLSANDLGLTGSHQSGIYLSKDSWPLFFPEPGSTGENREREAVIHWSEHIRSVSCFKWYGKNQKSEYRLTRIGDFFRDREEMFVGCLFILCRHEGEYRAYVLESEDDINGVLNFFGISPADTNCLLRFDLEERLRPIFRHYLDKIGPDFPDTETLAKQAQMICRDLYPELLDDPDDTILRLVKIEYSLFRFIEKEKYGSLIKEPFSSLDDLLSISLVINNRRKSRAGKSLEHHLSYILKESGVNFTCGDVTEEQKRPDFLFPGIESYRDPGFPSDRLFFLGSKTTCKDRWRQVINEADRIKRKHLFTLQQGFTSAQLREMESEGIVPVIPKKYHKDCKEIDRERLMSLKQFIDLVKQSQGKTGLF